ETAWRRLKVLATAAAGQTERALQMLEERPKGTGSDRWVADAVSIALAGIPTKGACDSLEAIHVELLKANELEEASRVGRLLGDMYQALGDDSKAVEAWIGARSSKGEPVPD